MVKGAKITATKTKTAAKAKASLKKPTVKKTSNKPSSTKEVKKIIPIPQGWPVSSTSNYATNNDTSEPQPQHLKPGNLLQANCNGSDVFLRKRAEQSSSLSLPTGGKTKGPTRFLIVFPGRMSLKPPQKKAAEDPKDEAEVDEEQEMKASGEGNSEENVDGEEETKDKNKPEPEPAKKKSPFAPTNPPQLLGKLTQLPDNNIQLSIPFASESKQQLVFSGRAIPIQGKFMTLSFKRIGGGKDSKKKSKMGTGSIVCKDVFRSVIVLGDTKLHKDAEDDPCNESNDLEENVTLRHYGGSDRTVDGGGQGGEVPRKSSGGKRDSLCSTKSSASEKPDESGSEPNSENDDNSAEEKDESDPDSDGEFMPVKKRRETGKSEQEAVASVPKRTSRRSTSKSVNISYADEDSDVDLEESESDNKSEEEEEDNTSESYDEFDELLDRTSKKPLSDSKPNAKQGQAAKKSAASNKKNAKTENGSDNEDQNDEKIKKGNKPKKPATSANKPKAATKTKPKKKAMASPLRSPITPRRRKKASPHKSPASSSKHDLIDLNDDDSFSFL